MDAGGHHRIGRRSADLEVLARIQVVLVVDLLAGEV
jgi:hypothetical protein